MVIQSSFSCHSIVIKTKNDNNDARSANDNGMTAVSQNDVRSANDISELDIPADLFSDLFKFLRREFKLFILEVDIIH
jgi:hypothetical protein